MSLEQVIADNTAAIRELIAALGAQAPKSTAAATAAKPAPTQPTAKAEVAAAPAKTAAASTPPAKSAATAAPASTAATKPQATALEYGPVGAAITAFAAANGREATLTKLADFGVKSGKELKPEQYADVLAAFAQEESVA